MEESIRATTRKCRPVPRARIVARGLANRCPSCANRSFFAPHSLQVRELCPICELPFNRGGGFRLASWVIDYVLCGLLFVLPILALGFRRLLPFDVAIPLAVLLGGIAGPLLLYRSSWSWCLMIYYFFTPRRLREANFDEW